MPNSSHTNYSARFLPSALDRPEWHLGHHGRAYVLRRETPNGPELRLVTWLAKGSRGSAEAMQADAIDVRDPDLDWALLRISPSGAFTIWDPRDMTASGSHRLNDLAAGVIHLDARLKSEAPR